MSEKETEGIRAGTMGELMEDYAIKPVPARFRSTLEAQFSHLSIPMCLYYLAIGSVGIALAGLKGAIICWVVSFAIITAMSTFWVRVHWRIGYSFEVTSRLFGWGHKGSILPSAASTLLLWSFYVMEIYWIAAAWLWLWPDLSRWGLYLALSVFFVLMTLFGHKMIAWWNYGAVPLGIGAYIYMLIHFFSMPEVSLSAVIAACSQPMLPPEAGGLGGAMNFALMAGALVGICSISNYGRFAKSLKGATWMGPVQSGLCQIVFPILGALTVVPLIIVLTPIVGADMAGQMAFETSVPFVVAMGTFGAIMVFMFQSHIQFTNIYLPSIAMSNIYNAITGKSSPRWVWVIVTTACSLGLLAGGLFGIMVEWSGWCGLFLMVVAQICLADYLYRKRSGYNYTEIDFKKIIAVNPLAIITFVVTCAISIPLWKAGIFFFGPIIPGAIIAFGIYWGLTALTKAKYLKPAEA